MDVMNNRSRSQPAKKIWKNLAKEMKAATGAATKVAEKRAVKAASKAVKQLSKATGVQYLPPVRALRKGKKDASNERNQKANGVGNTSRKGKQQLNKIIRQTVDLKKAHKVTLVKQKLKKQTKAAVKRKLSRRRRTITKVFPKKKRPLLTLKQVHRELAAQKEYLMAKRAVVKSVKHSRKIYPLISTRRRAYVARRRRSKPSNQAAAKLEVSDLRKTDRRATKAFKKAEAAKKKADPSRKETGKAKRKAMASKASPKGS